MIHWNNSFLSPNRSKTIILFPPKKNEQLMSHQLHLTNTKINMLALPIKKTMNYSKVHQKNSAQQLWQVIPNKTLFARAFFPVYSALCTIFLKLLHFIGTIILLPSLFFKSRIPMKISSSQWKKQFGEKFHLSITWQFNQSWFT